MDRRRERQILAFDTGPGNALIDDWVRRHTGAAADFDGALRPRGTRFGSAVARFLDIPFFDRTPPKSLDRDDFRDIMPDGLSLEDGAATLTEMTAAAVAAASPTFPSVGARMAGVRRRPAQSGADGSAAPPARRLRCGPVEEVGWDGDALEAQAFAYLAVRSVRGLPLSLPSTTGVARPMSGGRLFPASRRRASGRSMSDETAFDGGGLDRLLQFLERPHLDLAYSLARDAILLR